MKIGVFDSGFGGLTVLKEFLRYLPEYDYVYLGDNARTPYGTRSFETVYRYTLQCVKKLFELDCQLVILACNTASAKALRSIQQNDLEKIAPHRRVLGVIRPSVEALNKYTNSGNIGIFATPGTVASDSYVLEIAKLYPEINVFQQACPMWVPLVENNEHCGEGADYFVKLYINQLLMQNNEIDTLILGCTHYPLLINKIKKYLPKNIKVLSQGEIVAPSLKDYLKRHPEIETKLSKKSQRKFFTTDIPELFNEKAQIFLNNGIIPIAKQLKLD
ncbi:MAG: glutamate racemase [Bacteroidales bacterium]|nr:glutamate racemase [Bacteroidales bacterium]